jgi:phosphatidylglycerol:prolipoprotein diacylglycerol transferase
MILMFGALAAAWLASREARRRGFDPELVWDGLVWVLIGGIIGARLWHIFTPTEVNVADGLTTLFYLTHPLDALNIKKGGLGIPGAVIGGGLALYLFCRRRKLNFLTWADIAVPGVALGQAIGRWGNFVNQELYGRPTNLPWAIPIDPAHRLPGFENFETFHPLFLYECLWNLGLMGLLLWLGRRYESRLKAGDLFLIYLIGYPLGRFFLEFLRLDTAQIGGLNANQAVMAVVAVSAAAVLFMRHRRAAVAIETGAIGQGATVYSPEPQTPESQETQSTQS